MGRIRTIKPEFPHSQTMGRVSRDARLLFIQLWTLVDDEGRTRAASRMLASLLFPYDDDAPKLMDAWLEELEEVGAIRRYLVEGDHYLDIPTWKSHQKIDRPTKSRLPEYLAPIRRWLDEGSSADLDLDLDLDREGKGPGPRASVDAIVALSPHSKPTNLVNGSEQRTHAQHAWCSWPTRDGFCVLFSLHREFVGKLGPPDPETRLLAWYPAVVEAYAGRAVGENVFTFWRNSFAVWVGQATRAPMAAPQGRGAQNVAAAIRAVEKRQARAGGD